MAQFKIGMSAEDKAQLKTEIITSVINSVGTKFTPTVGDGEYIGVRFYDGDVSGTLVGNAVLLTASSMSDEDGYTQGTIEGVFPFDSITKVSKPCYFKGTNLRMYDANGNALSEEFAKIPLFYCRQWRGYDDNVGKNFTEYDIKATADESHGFFPHEAFKDQVSGNIKDYLLLTCKNLCEVTCYDSGLSTSKTQYLALSGKLAIDETDPSTIDTNRPVGNYRIATEYSVLQWLHYICFADRGYGWGGTANVSPFTAIVRDVKGYTVPSASDSDKTFSVLTLTSATEYNPYALLEVGTKVSFTTNEYAKGRVAQVTITAKTTSGNYTVYTYADEGISGLQGKKMHVVWKVDQGLTDSLATMNGIVSGYPAGYQPFREFYIENPYGFKLWLDGLCYYYGDIKNKDEGDSNMTANNRSAWKSCGIPSPLGGWANSMVVNSQYRDQTNGKPAYYGFLTSGLVNASSSTGCVTNNQFDNNNDYALFAGAIRENQGGISSLASAGHYTWSVLAGSDMNYGCWARVYRSARREDAE